MQHSSAIAQEALRQFAEYKLDHLNPYFPIVKGNPAVVPESKTFREFVLELKRILDVQQLPERAYDWIFSPHQILNKPRPNCGGISEAVAILQGIPLHLQYSLHTPKVLQMFSASLLPVFVCNLGA